MDTQVHDFIVYKKEMTLQKMLKLDLIPSNYELNRLRPKRENKKAIGLMKNKLGGKIMIKNYRIKSKNLLLLSEDKKAKGTQKCVIKRKLNL